MKAFTLVELLVVIAIVVLLLCLLGGGPIEALFYLCFGWVFYLQSISRELSIDWPNTLLAVITFLLFTIGSHWFGTWLKRADESASSDEQPTEAQSSAWRWRWSWSLTSLMVLMFVAGTAMVGITHQISWAIQDDEPFLSYGPRHAVQRMQSSNNLKQIGLGAHNYNETYRRFPAGVLVDEAGLPLHGWQTLMLPFVEQQPLFDQIDLTAPWDDESNRPAFQNRLPVYEDPGVSELGELAEGEYGPSHYSANQHLLFHSWIRRPEDMPDGTSNTLLAGEVRENIKPWGYPVNCRDPAIGINKSPNGFGVPERNGCQFVFADGAVLFVSETVDSRVLRALATPGGGEEVDRDDL